MEALAKQKKYAFLKIDVARWGSPVAQQFNIRSLPHLMIYDGAGKKVAEGSQASVDYLNRH